MQKQAIEEVEERPRRRRSRRKSEVAQAKPRDEHGRFLPAEPDKPRRRRRKSQASIIRAHLLAEGLWPAGSGRKFGQGAVPKLSEGAE